MNKLVMGLQVTVLGMGIVFIVLIILSVATSFLSRILNNNMGSDNKSKQGPKLEEKHESKRDESEELSPEILAVITAAVHEYLGYTEYKITTIKRSHDYCFSSWSFMGRYEQMNNLIK